LKRTIRTAHHSRSSMRRSCGWNDRHRWLSSPFVLPHQAISRDRSTTFTISSIFVFEVCLPLPSSTWMTSTGSTVRSSFCALAVASARRALFANGIKRSLLFPANSNLQPIGVRVVQHDLLLSGEAGLLASCGSISCGRRGALRPLDRPLEASGSGARCTDDEGHHRTHMPPSGYL